MSLFDFFFPDQAQATHLRRLADNSSAARTQQRIAQARSDRSKLTSEKRVKELENEVAHLSIILEAVLETLSEQGSLTRAELANKVAEIDGRDGVIDGRVTTTGDSNNASGETKFNFPD